jgi:hypothetical protein
MASGGHAGEELNADYFEAARAPKLIWEVPGAGHVGGLDARPAEHSRRVTGFFERALAIRPGS